MHGNSLYLLIAMLAAAVILSALFRRLHIPSTVAYLCVGLLVHPDASELESIQFIAEFGVVFLLFSLGLEFSLPRMLALRQTVFVIGSLQVLLCGALLAAVAMFIGASPAQAVVVAGALALSSTAVVTKEIAARNELNMPHGQLAIGILLFQDLAAVLLLIMVPALAGGDQQNLLQMLAFTLIKGLALFLALMGLGKWVLPRLFDEVAKGRSDELFVLTVLLTSLLAATLTHAFGLSMALGAFIAGMMLSETHYRHQIESDIRPFRDLLLGLFFVSVGMMVDIQALLSQWHWILLCSLGLLTVKTLVIALLAGWQGHDRATRIRGGLYLAQGGEFGFALFALAGQKGMLPAEWQAVLVATVVISIALSPWMIHGLSPWLIKKLDARDKTRIPWDAHSLTQASESLSEHVIICGFGRVGQTIGRFLRRENLDYIAIDTDPVRVHEASNAGEPLHFGDATRIDILMAMGLERAKLVVISHADTQLAARIISSIRDRGYATPILVRTRDDSSLAFLQSIGATEVVPEILEASLMLVSHVLTLMQVPPARIFNDISAVRRDRYQILHGYYHGLRSRVMDHEGRPLEILHPVLIPENAWACEKQLGDLELPASVYALRRADGTQASRISQDIQLQPGDTLVLQGSHENIDRAERRLLAG